MIYLGIPSHSGIMDMRQENAIADFRGSYPSGRIHKAGMSLLTLNFNQLLAGALNMRGEGITHFLLLHDDVVPVVPNWAGVMVRLMDEHKLGALGTIIPIKNNSNTTSTARDYPDGIRKLEIPSEEVIVLDRPDEPTLLINTGCLMIDLRHEWAERICFHIRDEMVKEGGQFKANVHPEDWEFSRWLRKEGVRYGATNAVRVLHVGRVAFDSCPWMNQEK